MMKKRRLCMVGLGSFMPRETSVPPCMMEKMQAGMVYLAAAGRGMLHVLTVDGGRSHGRSLGGPRGKDVATMNWQSKTTAIALMFRSEPSSSGGGRPFLLLSPVEREAAA